MFDVRNYDKTKVHVTQWPTGPNWTTNYLSCCAKRIFLKLLSCLNFSSTSHNASSSSPDASGSSPDASGSSPGDSGSCPNVSGSCPDTSGSSHGASGRTPEAAGVSRAKSVSELLKI